LLGAALARMLSGTSNDGLDFPNDLAACPELIRSLRRQNQELREKLAICEENERQVFQHIDGPGATPASLRNFGLLMAGKEPLIRGEQSGRSHRGRGLGPRTRREAPPTSRATAASSSAA
jgi:hypothetical protein